MGKGMKNVEPYYNYTVTSQDNCVPILETEADIATVPFSLKMTELGLKAGHLTLKHNRGTQ